jgi:hypothetical protein
MRRPETTRPLVPAADDSLAALLLPAKLEDFALEAHARDLLLIPRVVALEPSRVRTPRFLRDAASVRQGRRLRFPGQLRLVVLYHPEQYRLARALCTHHAGTELWYAAPAREALDAEDPARGRDWLAFDELAREDASATLPVLEDSRVDDGPLRLRLRELDVISPLAFVPGGRSRR